MHDCIFCKIIKGEIPATQEYEDAHCIAFNDLYPKERVHILIVPKRHIPTINDITLNDKELVGHMVHIAKDLAAKHKCPGYKLQWNVGKEGGQEVFHMHLHLLGK